MIILTRYIESFLRMVYPLTCKGCGEEVFDTQTQLCWRCLEQLPFTGFEKHAENPVRRIFTGRINVRDAFSTLYFNPQSLAQVVIHRIKYRGDKELGMLMGEIMGRQMLNTGRFQHLDAIVPLPLNEKKLRMRGYNQSELLANGMSGILHIPVNNMAVVRLKHTETQTRKTRIQRWQNVREVFDLKEGHDLEGKNVLLLDDVITTGATMESMGQELLKVPGLQLSMASLAYATSA